MVEIWLACVCRLFDLKSFCGAVNFVLKLVLVSIVLLSQNNVSHDNTRMKIRN